MRNWYIDTELSKFAKPCLRRLMKMSAYIDIAKLADVIAQHHRGTLSFHETADRLLDVTLEWSNEELSFLYNARTRDLE